jgi:HSP20 family protein
MALIRYEPINLFDQFDNEINRFFNGMKTQRAANQERGWMPAVDIHEEDDRFVLSADIPGVERKDVEITLEDGVLTIKGERHAGSEEKRKGFHRSERVYGTFMRQFTLPDTVNPENISASVREGVLHIEIPKQARPEPRKISVN